MKTITKVFLAALLALSGNFVIAQDEKAFNENTHIINLGVGLGTRYYGGVLGSAAYRSTPAISLSYEQAYKKKLGPGFLGIGAYLGYQRASLTDNNLYYFGTNYYYKHTWNYTMIAARGIYHWDVLNAKNAEVYAGVIIGLRIQTYNFYTNSPDPDDYYYYRLNPGSVYPAYSVVAGARWYFASKFGLFAELGYGISYATGGFSFKF
jgi:hypothetical protein